MRQALGAVWLIGVFVLRRVISPVLPARSTIVGALVSMAVTLGVLFWAYCAFVRVIEKRPVSELAPTGAFAELGLGLLPGVALFGATIGTL